MKQFHLLTILVVLLGISGIAYSSEEQSKSFWWGDETPEWDFKADLSADQEVVETAPGSGIFTPAPIVTDAHGHFDITFDRRLMGAEFVLTVNQGIGVVQAHIHCGRAGENGPVIALLVDVPGGTNVDGLLSSGMLTNADIEAADCTTAIGRPVNNIASLFDALLKGDLYANVHTLAYPAGEVRGQLFPDLDD